MDCPLAIRCVMNPGNFLRVVWHACGSLALTAHAFGGVYVGGTVVAAVAPMLDESPFRRRFVNVGIQADILQSFPKPVLFNEDSLGSGGRLTMQRLYFLRPINGCRSQALRVAYK
ncbi:MAG: hypothetical protein Ct9H300mP8_00520 [Gammaproteobacteria bacterium]|nr:MAG: hypothetical protein Ct9H300mP8_00520 [Gammaproteobacteria bacterium]